jgi:hypothetical protein
MDSNSYFPSVQISACFFHYAQSLWRKVQELGLFHLLASSNDSGISEDQRKKAEHWFLGAVGLALIPPSLVESTWVTLMDEYTPDDHRAPQFNDYLVSTYVESGSARFDVDIWNMYYSILNRLPRTNNHVEGYNHRMNSQFPTHPHIFQFVEMLRTEHEYQHHVAEESLVQCRKRKKVNDDIDLKLALLHEGARTIRRRTIRRGLFIADYSSHGQFVAGQFSAWTIRRICNYIN